jgi:DNA repair protein RecO (recombination protein O)
MSEILKTEAVVLKKINYGDSSKIATFFSKDHGKLSAIIKGARSPKSKIGLMIDVFNNVQLVFYRKNNRDLHFISQADMIAHYPKIKENLDKLKYSLAVLELTDALTIENEANPKLYRGLSRMLQLFNDSEEEPRTLLIKYILFILKETGYGTDFNKCSSCERKLSANDKAFFSYDSGILCDACSGNRIDGMSMSKELFEIFFCLTTNSNFEYNISDADKAIALLDKFIKRHVSEFRGFQFLQIL